MAPRVNLRSTLLNQLSKQTIVFQGEIALPAFPRFQPRRCSRLTPTKRTFVSTPNLWKKGSNKTSKVSNKKGASKEDDEALDQERPAERDPNDFSKLEAGITKALERLKNNLSKLHTGGRFNPDILANVRVHLEKGSKTSIRLGDLAQVLPKGGRSVIVLVSEKDHVKPIISAIQGSKDLNLQPQQDAHNSSQLNISIPPLTAESRKIALNSAVAEGTAALKMIRDARAVMQKHFKEMQKTVPPDDWKKAHDNMEKKVKQADADVKVAVDAAKKAMEQT